MAGTPSDYQRGNMDIAEQTATFHLVMGLTKWGSLYISAGLLFFTLLFCTHTGFVGSAISAVVMVVLGTLLLRDKKDAAAH
ncbi:MAG: cytochrome C oxidase subunit IV [Phenylobacterium sp. RIFCSPHIGHO2_01_FULL_69_31]|uniref:aa3-type cytochrome c oxidase subunit IV n=1 Tax=Phenylobacterium sp. RIFCSPHIGHO2_01_FULL_69_31 TaxID=1801944 RepID=UPI0008CA660C|nr:aa3-type cytochrome c oxidase subunit IV [Phenylobacterium sp. RIFCSPHIGHO2_01_FULL_69_31]OHB27402.1 MAG: cytochrome C oxidase subunit IV [Phenylobacterium sp. RIFCSPHIGHO2_01_FULL_69_31]